MSKIANLKNWNQFRSTIRGFGFNSTDASILYNLYLDGEILDKELEDSKYLESFLIEETEEETEEPDSKYLKDDLLSKISSKNSAINIISEFSSDINSLIFKELDDRDLINLILAYKINNSILKLYFI